MTSAQIIVLATPVFLLLIAAEFAVGRARGRNTYRFSDTLNSVGLGVMSQVTGVFGQLLRVGGPGAVNECVVVCGCSETVTNIPPYTPPC